MTIPSDLQYTKEHEWVRIEGDLATVGITDHAQEALGDLVYVELPEVGRQVEPGEAIVVVESVKAASDVYAPVSGEIVEVNEALSEHPELVNTDPYGKGWLVKIRTSGKTVELLDAETYATYLSE